MASGRRVLEPSRCRRARPGATLTGGRSGPEPRCDAGRPHQRQEPQALIISCTATRPAPGFQVATEVSAVLERRAKLAEPPVGIAVSDAVALGIAAAFTGATPSGRVMESLSRTGSADSDELIAAARFEQGYASPEGHAALYCLIGWARSRVHRIAARATAG